MTESQRAWRDLRRDTIDSVHADLRAEHVTNPDVAVERIRAALDKMPAIVEVEVSIGWTQESAIALCREVERICPRFGCHVALTGGCLYKDGSRKDLDLLFYRIRQVDKIDVNGLFVALEELGIERISGDGWVIKATWRGRASIDCFFPEVTGGDYGCPLLDAINDTLDLSGEHP